MIGWIQRAAAASTGIMLAVLLFPKGSFWAGIGGCAVNLCLVMDSRLPLFLRRVFRPGALWANTLLSVYGVLAGGAAALGVCAVSGALLSWNISLFLQRWPAAPLPSQYHYLRSVAAVVALGLTGGLSALALADWFYLPLWAAFFLMLAAGSLLLHSITRAIKKAPESQ